MREGKLKWNRRMKPTFQTQHTTTKFLRLAIAVGLISLQLDTRRQGAFPGTQMKRREPETLVDVPNPKRSGSAAGSKAIECHLCREVLSSLLVPCPQHLTIWRESDAEQESK